MKNIYIIFVLCGICGVSTPAAAQTYSIDPNHVNIVWFAGHFGFSNPTGKFAKAGGTFTFNQDAPQNSTLSVKIDTNSLITGIPKFDDHLKSKDFLDVAKYPEATFVSEKITITGEATADITGQFTLHGIAKPLVLKTRFNKAGINPASDKMTAGFSASAVLKRSEHGIVYALPGVSDEVELRIEVEGQAVN